MFYHKNYQTKKEVIFITSYEFRNDTMFLRNQFKSVGMFKLPLVKKQEISLEDVSLIGYDKINQSNDYKSIVHFFLDDYKFESIYNNPEKKIEALRQFKAVLHQISVCLLKCLLHCSFLPRLKTGGQVHICNSRA